MTITHAHVWGLALATIVLLAAPAPAHAAPSPSVAVEPRDELESTPSGSEPGTSYDLAAMHEQLEALLKAQGRAEEPEDEDEVEVEDEDEDEDCACASVEDHGHAQQQPPALDPEVVCAEVERIVHDEAENLGKSEAELRQALQAQGCFPSTTPKKSTDMVLYGAYPYAGGARGYILRRVPYWWSDPTGLRLFSGQLAVEGAHAGRDAWGAGGHFRGSVWRVGIETSHFFSLDRPAKVGLYHGDVHFVIAPILRPRAVWWIGVGGVWVDRQLPLEDHHEGGSGLSGTTSLDLFPLRPFVLSARVDAGRIAKGSLDGAVVLRGRATAGVMLRRLELYAGYEGKLLGDQVLRGPVLGLRTWF